MPSRRTLLGLGAGCIAAAALGLPPRAKADPADPALAAEALMAAYPLDVVDVVGNEIVFASGRRMTIDDGREKTHDQRLEQTDLQDMFHDLYPWGAPVLPPPHHFNPGRYRADGFFREVYGASQQAVASQLVSVDWLANTRPTRLPVHGKYGIAERLARISAELEGFGPDLLPYLEQPGGTFNWRPIAGTDRLSAHSYGISIDINTGFADYWRWAGGGPDPSEYRNRIPLEIALVFEAEDFIWGGRWYHYDTMHFEYRPELRHYQRLLDARGG
ncbi:MAG: M15 family metallopeptidase [Alphaproteobacteria bacterium]